MGISPLEFYNILLDNNVEFFTGVPDSLLKQFCLCLDDNVPKEKHIIAANEGNAIALAAGYHLGTGSIPLVYMQNSGLGNAINPLLSLCDPNVFSIPVLLLVGWRGEPGTIDEPQHIKQGRIQNNLLEALEVPYSIISKDNQDIAKLIKKGIDKAQSENCPYVFSIKRNTFDKYVSSVPFIEKGLMTREATLKELFTLLPDDNIIVSTTGKTSREIFEIREKNNETHNKDFLTIGSMGHCSSIALGVSLSKPTFKVTCIDGDGSLIMHMGSLSTIGKVSPPNYYHILMNNYVHESVGGQSTGAEFIDMPSLLKANGYKNVYTVNNKKELLEKFHEFYQTEGPNFLEIKIRAESRKDLGRPTIKPIDNKIAFLKYMSQF